MQFTKTPEELAARRARVSSFFQNNRVETDTIRTKRRKEQKRLQLLEEKADQILRLEAPVRARNNNTSIFTPKTISKAVPGAATPLPASVKNDRLAVEADKIIKELLS